VVDIETVATKGHNSDLPISPTDRVEVPDLSVSGDTLDLWK
jgi:hypothetical protein